MTEAKDDDLLSSMDAAARELLKAASAATMGEAGSLETPQPVDMKSRIAAFQAVTTYLAMREKLRPEGAKPSGIQRYQHTINGGTSGSRASRSRRQPPDNPPFAIAGGTDSGED